MEKRFSSLCNQTIFIRIVNWDWKDWSNFINRNNFLLLLENYNRVNELSPINIDTASTITILPTRNKKPVSQVKRKLFADDTNIGSKNIYSFDGKIILTDKSIE